MTNPPKRNPVVDTTQNPATRPVPAGQQPPAQRRSSNRFLEKLAAQQTGPKHWSILIFGPSGVGKTSLLASSANEPQTAPFMLLNFDGGESSASGVDPEKLTVFLVRDWQDYNEAFDFLANSKHGYKGVGVDSLSETHVYSLLYVADEAMKRKPRQDENTIEQQDYGKAMVQLRRFLREFRRLKMHTVFTALSKSQSAGREGTVLLPSLFGQMAEEVVGMFEVSAYLSIEEKKVKRQNGDIETIGGRRLTLQNAPGIRAKVRTPLGKALVDDKIDMPYETGMTALFRAIQNYKPAGK